MTKDVEYSGAQKDLFWTLVRREFRSMDFVTPHMTNPTIADNDGIVQLGATALTGDYSSNLTGLFAWKFILCEAFLSNGEFSYIRSDPEFYTKDSGGVPTVTTSACKLSGGDIGHCGWQCNHEGGADSDRKGHLLWYLESPQTTGTKVAIGNGQGLFTTTLTGLTNDTGISYRCLCKQ